ncbi:MAG: Lipid flippase FtsW [Pseudomonadota bacterium]|jgi:cell division protein FtsW
MQYNKLGYDAWIANCLVVLLSLGFIMVVSASLPIAENRRLSFGYFAWHQGLHLFLGMLVAIVVSYIPMRFWHRTSNIWLMLSLFGLFVLLIPGVSREINGSIRWLFIGPISIQISDCAKIALILYMASYLVRRHQEVKTRLSGFLKPLLVLTAFTGLLLLEPDFGAAVVMISTVMGLLFLGGVPFIRFFVLFALVLCGLIVLSLASPYRIERLTSFLNPWADQFNSGYQLTQALIAFGRGGWLGVGLGSSVQKLLYLPEAHTDFLFAVLAEELGLLGGVITLLIFSILVGRIFWLGKQAIVRQQIYSAYVAYGIGLWLGLQTLISVGVNVGLFPTKGLTLPFMSYGGSSIVVSMFAIGLLLRIDYEKRYL